tara:strand:+ start:1017 stop:1292 length:276 start_codon:yes stop_codon:yes gene_type:complete
MAESLILVSFLIVLVVVLIFMWGEGRESVGREESKRGSAEDKLERISKGLDKLTGPRPSRRLLAEHWERRLRRSKNRDPDTDLPDSESRSD